MTVEKLTNRRIEKSIFSGKRYIIYDTLSHGLGVRISATKKSFIFQARVNKKSIRMTIGPVNAYPLEEARKIAYRFNSLIAQGIDPRLEIKRKLEAEQAILDKEERKGVQTKEAFSVYVADRSREKRAVTVKYGRKTKIAAWGKRTIKDHSKMSTGTGVFSILVNDTKLTDLTKDRVAHWLQCETDRRPTQTSLGFRYMRAFANWCDNQDEYSGLIEPGAFDQKIHADLIPVANAKDECLQREQLFAWFDAVSKYKNKVISAALQTILLIGARREEVLRLEWNDIDFRWCSIRIRDKVEKKGYRTIPLTPYISSLLSRLPKRNKWVFSSMQSSSGRLIDPSKAHAYCLDIKALPHLTMHDLRRSFGTLSEWVETPVGVVYQIQGHKPSGTAEKHYRKRPLDLLRKWHTLIEGWILEQAGIEQPEAIISLRVVNR